MPAVLEIMVMAVAISSSSLGPASPKFPKISGMVGISVGMTTPEVELNQLMMPEVMPMMVTEVAGVMTLASASDNRWMPPSLMMMCISTPTPVISSRVPQGIRLMASPSSATRRKDSTMATAKPVRPTLTFMNRTKNTITAMPTRVIIWFLLNAGISFRSITLSECSLYPPRRKYTMTAYTVEDRMPFRKKGRSIPVSPKPAHRLSPMIPVAARGETPPPDAPSTDRAESIAGSIPISAASAIENTIMIAMVGTVPGPSAESTTEKT